MNPYPDTKPRLRTWVLCAGLASLAVGGTASARDVLVWSRGADGRLEIHQRPAAIEDRRSALPTAGSLQRLAMPEPPGPSAFDRALEREREQVTRRRAAERAQRERLAESARRDQERRRVEIEDAAERRRASRAEQLREEGSKRGASRRSARPKTQPRERPAKADVDREDD